MKTIAQFLTAVLFVTPLAFTSAASASTQPACPSSPGQALTIQQVMINFGRYVTPADDVTNAGLSPMNGSYTDAQIQAAASDLGFAIACADAVTNAAGNNPNLIPSAALSMTTANRTNYVNDFLDLMEEFHDSLVAYQTGLTQLAQTPAASRNYQALGALKDACAQAADHAHSKLGQEASIVSNARFISARLVSTPLQSAMHQIGTIFRQISSTDTDASQNAANAALAQQLVPLFNTCAAQVPDAIKQLPAAQQAAAQADYQSRLQQEAGEASQLATAFTNGDLATAASLVTSMTQQKTDGHSHYNP